MFCDLRDTVYLTYFLLPVNLVDECINKHVRTRIITLQALVIVAFPVVDDTWQQVLWEFTLLEFANLFEHQVLHLFKALTLFWGTHEEECAMIVQQLRTSRGSLHLHRLVEVEVEESCTSVAEHILHQFEGISLQLVGFLCAPSHPESLCLLSDDGSILRRCEWWQWCKRRLLYISSWLPTREILVEDGDSLVHIHVASHTDSHIIGHIPLLEIILDICDRRILQMVLCSDGGLESVGVVGPQHL